MRNAIKMRIRRPAMRAIGMVLLPVTLFYCQGTIAPPDRSSDLIEYESVWQYCRAWSIYQDSSLYEGRIPADPFAFLGDSAGAILAAIHDTLRGGNYTCYYDGPLKNAAASGEIAANGSTPPQSVFFDPLTDSTALITITTFEATPFEEFLRFASVASLYPNIVFNVKNNKGGYIEEAAYFAVALLPSGTAIIQSRERQYDENAKSYATVGWHPWITDAGPMAGFSGKRYAVIMNDLSASATEILISALYEGAKAPLIGTKSFGKGMGQIIQERRTRKPLLITALQFKGVSARIGDYHRNGIEPDSVPLAIQSQISDPDDWHKQLFYAVKMLEPAISADSINYPPDRTQYGVSRLALGIYKVVAEK
jgi:hypothetical protein